MQRRETGPRNGSPQSISSAPRSKRLASTPVTFRYLEGTAAPVPRNVTSSSCRPAFATHCGTASAPSPRCSCSPAALITSGFSCCSCSCTSSTSKGAATSWRSRPRFASGRSWKRSMFVPATQPCGRVSPPPVATASAGCSGKKVGASTFNLACSVADARITGAPRPAGSAASKCTMPSPKPATQRTYSGLRATGPGVRCTTHATARRGVGAAGGAASLWCKDGAHQCGAVSHASVLALPTDTGRQVIVAWGCCAGASVTGQPMGNRAPLCR